MIRPRIFIKNPTVLLIAGVIFGVLSLWILSKIMRPVVRSVCVSILDDGSKELVRRKRLVKVEAEPVQLQTMTRRVSAVGKLKANSDVTIRSEVSGRIKDILFVEGTEVTKGEEIIRFDDSDARAELQKAEAQLLLHQADFDRSARLHDQKIGSAREHDKAKAQLAVSKGEVELAKARLQKTSINAPFDGTIGLINASPGAYLQAGQELVTIVNNIPMKVQFKVPEQYVKDVGVGQTVEVSIDAFPNEIFVGVVEAMEPKIDADSHSFLVRAILPNEDGKLFAGLFANVSLIIGEQGNTITIEDKSLEREGDIQFVWLIEKEKARRVRVLTGTREKGKVEIIAGLKPDQMVVTDGQLKLADGVYVEIINQKNQKEESTPSKSSQEGDSQPKQEKPETSLKKKDLKETPSNLEESKKEASVSPK